MSEERQDAGGDPVTPTVGVEEEFLLVDARTLRTEPAAAAVLARAAAAATGGGHPGAFHRELLDTQVEAATGVCHRLPALRSQLLEGRSRLAAAARPEGARIVASGTPVLAGPRPGFSPGPRFDRIADVYAGVVGGYQACGLHVHVGVPDRETAVAVVNHLSPWLPTLLAVSVNSPYDRGRDSGYASWRMLEQARFPGSGLPPWCVSAAAYDRQLARLVDAGILVDARMTFWLARPSAHLPTVEVRAADTAPTVDDAVLQAALTRALVATALADLAAGREAAPLTGPIGAAAVWSAARYGLDGPAVDPVSGRRVPATGLLRTLLRRIRPALEETGDAAEVRVLLAGLRGQGTGAARQRRAGRRGVRAVAGMLADQTVHPSGGTLRATAHPAHPVGVPPVTTPLTGAVDRNGHSHAG